MFSGKHQTMLADVLSRSFEDMTPSERELWIPHTDPRDDFLFAINSTDPLNLQPDTVYGSSNSTSNDFRTSEVNSWQNYSISYDCNAADNDRTDVSLKDINSDYTSDGLSASNADTWYDCSTDFDEQITSSTDTDLRRLPYAANAQFIDAHDTCNATTARRRSKQQTPITPDVQSPTDMSTPSALPTDSTDDTDEMLNIPSVSPSDYESDPYLCDLFTHLSRGTLPVNNERARIILLLSEDFKIQRDGLMYRISVPRGKQQSRVQTTEVYRRNI
jgi:hypothetical protein